MKTLYVVPIGGLCNRLRVVLSAIESQRPTRIEWAVNADCAATWSHLFLPLAEAPDVSIVPCPLRHTPTLARMRINKVLAFLRLGCFLRPVFTGNELCPFDAYAIARHVHLAPALAERVEWQCRNFDAHTIGIHIRRTDHTQSMQVSTLSAFRTAICACINSDPEARFYVASDEEDVKHQLSAEFPGRILYQECRGTRASLQGMEEAVIDLWSLSRTQRIIGSYWSSYSCTAAELGGIPLSIAGAPEEEDEGKS